MSIPKYNEIQLPLLRAVSDKEIHKINDLVVSLAKEFKLTEEELLMTYSTQRVSIFKDRVSWARTYLKKAGLVHSPKRATVQITEAGLDLLAENPKTIDNALLSRYPSFQEFIKPKPPKSKLIKKQGKTEETPDALIETAYLKIHDRLKEELMSEIIELSPYVFEKFVLDLLIHMGYGET